MSFITQQEDGVHISVKVVPNASKDELSGMIGERLKVRVQSPPEDGKANLAVCNLFAKSLDLKKHQVAIVSGNSSPLKTVNVQGVAKRDVCKNSGCRFSVVL